METQQDKIKLHSGLEKERTERRGMKMMIREKGITLIALVVTIVVLLILAGVSISLVLGENGIIAKAKDTSIVQSHTQVRDAIMLAYGDYQINIYVPQNGRIKSETKIASTTAVTTSTSQQTFLEFLQEKNYIDETGTVNVENLLGTKINYGNGTGNTDVYKVEEIDDNYKLNYYDKNEEITEIEIIAPIGNGSDEIKYTQDDIDETLKYFTFDEETGTLTSNPDVLGDFYTKAFPKKVIIPKEINGVKVTSIKSGYTGEYAGRSVLEHSGVEEVVILSEIETLDDEVFSYASSLKRIVLPNSITSIGDSALKDCSSLSSIIMPQSVTSIGVLAFAGCDSLADVLLPGCLTSIGDGAFCYCRSLTSLTIPAGVELVGMGVFDDCSSLKNINVDSGNTTYSSENGILFNKNKTNLVRYPEGKTEISYIIPDVVTSIGDYAFCKCSSLANITIPNSVKKIGRMAFCDCEGLTEIIIPNSITTIEDGLFDGCKNLVDVTMPNGIISIGSYSFRDCSSLANITIPNSVKNIYEQAFNGCSSLINITIPNNVTSIGYIAFSGCDSLTTVNYTGTEAEWKAISIFDGNDSLKNAKNIVYNYNAEQ